MTLTSIVLTTGGTGGHIFPALAVAEELRRRYPEARLTFVGGESGPEGDMARKAGLEFMGLPARGIVRAGRGLAAFTWIARALAKALRLLGRLKPQAVAGFGGYAGFCPVLAARLKGIPTVVHEQNSVPGVANRVLGRLADAVCVSFPDESRGFPAQKTVRTGNPVRATIAAAARDTARDGRRLLILGGSQGAKAVNSAILDVLPDLAAAGVSIRHQTGKADFSRVQAAYESVRYPGADVAPFIDDMAEAYAWADLAVCRAGATTIAELAVSGVPSVLVPFPYATHDHQTANARYLSGRGAALLAPEKDIEPDAFGRAITDLLADPKRLGAMSRAAVAQGRPEAAGAVADVIAGVAARRAARRNA